MTKFGKLVHNENHASVKFQSSKKVFTIPKKTLTTSFIKCPSIHLSIREKKKKKGQFLSKYNDRKGGRGGGGGQREGLFCFGFELVCTERNASAFLVIDWLKLIDKRRKKMFVSLTFERSPKEVGDGIVDLETASSKE
jgi:hypothetical protein